MYGLLNNQQGFTFIEVLIYIALFTLIIGGGVISILQIFTGQHSVQDIVRKESEINFVMRKIDWVINGAESGDILLPSSNGPTLIVRKYQDPLLPGFDEYRITASSSKLFFKKNSAAALPVNNYAIEVSNLNITRTGNNPEVVTIEMDIDGEPIEPITRYVRGD